ncbi:hypothetical protein BUALT_Bualt04G0012100 [Buddleja alternifolia]|uniref:Holocarboxylase synthetase n=1 Tax=Buddleja alternifolia TaxID=168488 RepID=A0AAV6XRY5_9LAMI|nr:hypothetical protein BUALT_Bualt04G0012100 [Buddleja alternifolia]
MAKKRKSDATRLDEVDRGMYTAFCSAANSLSLYTQAMHQQRLSFQADERHGLEKLYSWILRHQEDGVRVMTGDILAYMQCLFCELMHFLSFFCNISYLSIQEPPSSPRPPFQHPSQTAAQPAHSGFPLSSNAFAPPTIGQGLRSDQSKNSIFSIALSSPVRRSLQHYHLSQGGGHFANNAMRSNENNGNQTRDHNAPSSNDTSMDMHAEDSPDHDSPY